jgi:putative hydrolase of the HAD superfamily
MLDADGVIQHIPGGWYEAMEPFLGERAREFLHETWSEELPMLAGRGDYLPVLAEALTRYGITVGVHEVYRSVWHRIDLVQPTVRLIHELRAGGYGVHLATNQERHRGGYMRSVLGYDDLFDVSCYSYDLGFAKPDVGFFQEATRRIGADPSTILFIDDTLPNVDGARAAGLMAEHWHFEHGHDTLRALLHHHAVALPAQEAGRDAEHDESRP